MSTLETKSLGQYSFAELLGALSAKTPAPGGGAAACAAGALGAALGGMVVAYSLGKADLEAHRGVLESAERQLAMARRVLLELGDEDAAAYGVLSALRKRPKDEAGRAERIEEGVRRCVQIPLAALAAHVDVLALLESLVGKSNPHLRSDLAVAAVLCEAGARGCAWNVRINLSSLSDAGERGRAEDETRRLVEKAGAVAAGVQTRCAV
jgi:formiminotetrahydrofolate cyclodeaminase